MVPELDLQITVGSRVEAPGGYKGTVKYVGEVVNTNGKWLGIDWDDPSRGKHNGVHEGVKYFDASYPTSGSFVRPGNVNSGITCIEAIQKRYGLIHEKSGGIDVESIAQVKKGIKAKFFEVVGFEKVNKQQSDFSSLQVVFLRDQPVNCGGPPESLSQLCPKIRELDLSRTLLSNWNSVTVIVRQLPHLEILNLSDNRLELPSNPEQLAEYYKQVTHLILARLSYNWDECLTCAEFALDLEVYQVPYNKITLLKIPDNHVFEKLRLLDLEGNVIKYWYEINKLGGIITLERLNLSNTSMENVYLPIADNVNKTTCLFPSLQQVMLNENCIRDWCHVSELDKLKSLQELKLRDNPVLDKENLETNRQIIIARIKNLKVLNGIEIVKEERRGAEFDFIKRHGLEWLSLKTNEDKSSFHSLYPCYQRLIDKLGPPEESELKKKPTSIKSQLIKLEIYSPDHATKSYNKKLPYNMSIEKLIGLSQRLFNTGSEIPRLTCVSQKEGIEVPLDNQLKDLNYYSIEDGDKISVRW